MNNKIKEIRKIIWENINDEDGQVIECDEFEDIYGLIKYIKNKFNCDIKINHCGGFDSPGYDVDCYAWAGIIDGELYFDSVEQERY